MTLTELDRFLPDSRPHDFGGDVNRCTRLMKDIQAHKKGNIDLDDVRGEEG
jgi:hypothetical protein